MFLKQPNSSYMKKKENEPDAAFPVMFYLLYGRLHLWSFTFLLGCTSFQIYCGIYYVVPITQANFLLLSKVDRCSGTDEAWSEALSCSQEWELERHYQEIFSAL
jgi:hypothetical protein